MFVQVLGLGSVYTGYGDKIRLYNSYLQKPAVNDNDVILLIDAYDVLLFPPIKHAAQVRNHFARLLHRMPKLDLMVLFVKVLKKSKSPIMFCAESGQYPEFSRKLPTAFIKLVCLLRYLCLVSHAYPFDDARHEEMLGFGPKFMNSGCILGRAGQMRELIIQALSMATTVDDDQQIFVRYMLTQPSLISLDTRNAYSITGYREGFPAFDTAMSLSYVFELVLQRGQKKLNRIGLVHCNNMKSYSLCSRVMLLLNAIHEMYYSGEQDSDDVLRVLDLYWTGKQFDSWNQQHKRGTNSSESNNMKAYRNKFYSEALALIMSSPTIQANATSEGGQNYISDDITGRILFELKRDD
jgi:hypothetical protein